MSAGNWFETRRKTYQQYTISLSSADRVSYTVRVGGQADGFIHDRVVNWDHLDAYGNIAITLPDGIYEGQRVLINYASADTEADSIVVTPATALTTATYTLTDVGDYCSLEWTNATGGWEYLSEVTT